MKKKYVFIAKDLLLHGICDEPIYVTQVSQIMKDNENTTFSDINETSQKPIFVVVKAELRNRIRRTTHKQKISN